MPQTLSLNGDDWTVYPLMPNEWLWRRVWEREPVEARVGRVRAVVPGVVQHDLLDAGALPHPHERENSRLWEWTWARDWIYEKEFTPPAELAGQVVRLRFEGVDHTCHVYLNGHHLVDHEGMFVPFEVDVTETLRPGEVNRLLVVVERAPDEQGQIGWTSRVRHWKARFAYGWDFTARLVPVGIWDDVSLIVTGDAWLRDVSVYTNLSLDQREAAVSVVHEFGARRETAVTVRAEVTFQGFPTASVQDPITVFASDTSLVQSLTIPRVELWWPNGYGAPALYQLRVLLLSRDGQPLDVRTVEFGVRRLEWRANEGAPEDALPYTLVVNGRRIFMKGWNWVPIDHLYGRAMPERYEHLLRLAHDAHVNLLRVWGGGLIEKRAFYEWCDRLGILVWQDLPQSSSGLDNRPPSDGAYVEMARLSTEAIAARHRSRPSLALWCGGNELTDEDLVPLSDANPTLQALRQTLELVDPQRLWLPTTPSGPSFLADPAAAGRLHDVHGPWHYLGVREQSRVYEAIDPLLHSEFGVEAAAHRITLERIAPAAELWPPDASNPHWVHHGGGWWLQRERVEAAFGPIADMETFVRASQMMQAEGLRYAVEAHRRRKWRCSGTLPWQLNEPWPNATCTNAVDYFGQPKPAYYTVKRAYRPFHVSAAYATLSWAGEAEFVADVWLHNSGEERSLLNVGVTLADVGGQVFYQESLAAEAPAETSENVGDVRWRFPRDYQGVFVLFLQVIDEEGQTLAENAYVHSAAPEPCFAPLLSPLATSLTAERAGSAVRIENGGSAFALFVAITSPEFTPIRVSDSHLVLPPGETREITVEGAAEVLQVTAWNHPTVLETRP
jgi:beta-mannosidase